MLTMTIPPPEEATLMNPSDLDGALECLSTARIEQLVDRLERDPDVELTIGAWRPQCPMVLAGFDPDTAESNTPEHRFARAWDRLAKPDMRWWMPLPRGRGTARHSDVQLLLRTANAVLARRAAGDHPRGVPAGPRVATACQA
jgi:hypothetical protein